MSRAKRFLFIVSAGVLCAVLPTTEAGATPLPTSVAPKGDYFTAAMKPGTGTYMVGNGCSVMTSKPASPLGTSGKNQVPSTGNPTVDGPVTILIRHPVMRCFNQGASSSATKTFGVWKLVVQHTQAWGDIATLKIPKAGIVLSQTFIYYTCTETVAPDAAASVSGKWDNGSPSTLTVVNAVVTYQEGGPCGDAKLAGTVSFTWTFTDMSHPGTDIVVG